MQKFWRMVRWTVLSIALAYGAIVIYAYPHDHQAHLDTAAVAKIEAQKITMGDVDGEVLPPAPDPSVANATVAGIDANDNGIRDDVELAIFSEYPTSSATSTAVRAAELQYALDLQMQLTEVSDTATWIAAEVQANRGFACIYDASNGKYESFENEVEELFLNTQIRTDKYHSIQQFGASYKLSSDPDCDVDRN